MVFIYLLIFLIGTCIGSFINVVLFRLDKKSGILAGRSECPNCRIQIKAYDLVPLLSFVILKGKCRNCKKKISSIYPIVELSTGLVFLLFFLKNGLYPGWSGIYELIILSSLVALLFFDYLYMILPDKIVFPLIAVVFMSNLYNHRLLNPLLTGLVWGGVFAFLYFFSKGKWMGFGDVKLVFLVGLILGYPLGIFVVILSIWLAAFWGIALVVAKKADLKTALPFGSFMASVAILTIIFQNEIRKIISGFF